MLQIHENDKELLSELRLRIEDILQEESEYRNSDEYLMTWLLHKNRNLSNTESAFRKHTKWRRENRIESIHLEIFEDLAEILPYEVHGLDKLGRPIIWMPYGKWDFAAVAEKVKPEDYLRYGHQYCQLVENEIIAQYNKRKNENGGETIVWQFIGVYDLGDLSYRQLLDPKIFKLMTTTIEDGEGNWPLRCGSLIGINAPFFVRAVLNILKPFISKNTRSKIKLYSSNSEEWKKALVEHIDKKYIPICYGGDRESSIII